MATPITALSLDQQYQQLGRLYRALWKRLDNASHENKWLDIRPIGDDQLKESVQSTLTELQDSLGGSAMILTVLKDCETAEQLLSNPEPDSGVKFEEFREYLRDTGLRYAHTR
jgi:hypothetical protein